MIEESATILATAKAAELAAANATIAAEKAALLVKDVAVANAVVSSNISYIQKDIAEIKSDFKDMKGQYVTLDRFEPIQRLVYGLVTLMLVAIVGAILKLVFAK